MSHRHKFLSKGLRRKRGEMNKTEEQYALKLAADMANGEVHNWWFEGITLRISHPEQGRPGERAGAVAPGRRVASRGPSRGQLLQRRNTHQNGSTTKDDRMKDNNPTAAPCPICGPDCKCLVKVSQPGSLLTVCDNSRELLFIDQDGMIRFPDGVDPNEATRSAADMLAEQFSKKHAEQSEKIKRLEELYAASLKTIADRDTLIAHIRDRHDCLLGLIAAWDSMNYTHAICSCSHCKALGAACDEPTP